VFNEREILMGGQILVVDDEPLMCRSLSEVISRAGYEVFTANNGYEAIEFIQQESISVIITDMNMPKMDGIEVLRQAKAIVPNVAVIVVTGYATVDSAVEAMKYGAVDYITKPFSPSKINTIIERAIFNVSTYPTQPSTRQPASHSIVTTDPQMLEILDRLKLVAQSDSSVLIQGESGTGKELIARALHSYSNRSNGTYVAVNCAAIPESLLESELFGHEKGAFTNAIARRIGKIELAHGGTLLLDEIGEMAKPFQAKLLRAIQEREVVRIGGNQQIKVDVRIVATTNRNLVEEVDAGTFREDLFYRLCVIPVFLPPLRERKDDIPVLSQYFAQKSSIKMGKKIGTIPLDVIESLMNYQWPGNIRELENTIERAVALSTDGSISLSNIFFSSRKKLSKYISLQVGASLEDAEKELITRTLEDVEGSKQKAADILGITTKTIRAKLRQYGYDQYNNEQETVDV
jgi:two-component system, NtrC family, response regulator AtoC